MFDDFQFEPLNPPYYYHLRKWVKQLPADEGLILSFHDKKEYSCTICGISCRRPWSVPVTQEYYEKWSEHWANSDKPEWQKPFKLLPRRARGRYYAEMVKRESDGGCVFLYEDGRCHIHNSLGLEQKPESCQRYPEQYQMYPNGYGYLTLLESCSAVPELLLPEVPLQIARLAATELDEPIEAIPQSWSRERFLLWVGMSLDVLAQSEHAFKAQQSLLPVFAELLEDPEASLENDLKRLDSLYQQLMLQLSESQTAAQTETYTDQAWERLVKCLCLHLEELAEWLPQQVPGGPALPPEAEAELERLLRGYYQRLLPVMAYRGQRFDWQYLNLAVRMMALDLRARYEIQRIQAEQATALSAEQRQRCLSRSLNRVAFQLGHELQAEVQPLFREFAGASPFDNYRQLLHVFNQRFVADKSLSSGTEACEKAVKNEPEQASQTEAGHNDYIAFASPQVVSNSDAQLPAGFKDTTLESVEHPQGEVDTFISLSDLIETRQEALNQNTSETQTWHISENSLDLHPMKAPYFEQFQNYLKGPLMDVPDAFLFVGFSDYARHECVQCGINCFDMNVLLKADYVERWLPFWQSSKWERYRNPFAFLKTPYKDYIAGLQREAETRRCIFLMDDMRCFIHAELGPEAKPPMCQKFPHELVVYPQGLGTLSILKSCSVAPALMLQDQQIYAALLHNIPDNAVMQHNAPQANRTTLLYWLGAGLDILDAAKGPSLQRLRSFAQMMLQLEGQAESESLWQQAYQDYCVQPEIYFPETEMRKIMWGEWQKILAELFPPILSWLAQSQGHGMALTPEENGFMNRFLWSYMRQALLADLYRLPQRDQLLYILGLKALTVQAIALYFRAQKQEPLSLHHLGRALNTVGRFSHFVRIAELLAETPQENLQRLDGLLQLDFSLWAVAR